MKKALSILLTLCLLASAASLLVASAEEEVRFEVTPPDANYTYEDDDTTLIVKDGANITVSTNDQLTAHNIVVEGDATITLAGVTCTPVVDPNDPKVSVPKNPGAPAIDIQNGAHLTLVLASGSTNTLTGTSNTAAAHTSGGNPGIHVPDGASLTIRGEGELTATGADIEYVYSPEPPSPQWDPGSGAGIGGKGGAGGGAAAKKGGSSGAITIEGGLITATSGHLERSYGGGGAGIGAGGGGGDNSGPGGDSGLITIAGGVINATSSASNYGTGAGLGSGGGGRSRAGGDVTGAITITGGVINAKSGASGYGGGAGIGSGGGRHPGGNVTGAITITGGLINATGGNSTDKGGGGAGIGSGGGGKEGYNGGKVDTITIEGGVINATGGDSTDGGGSGAGLGSGGGGSDPSGNGGNVNAITIAGGAINATGGENNGNGGSGAGLGSGGGGIGGSRDGTFGTVTKIEITGGVSPDTTFSNEGAAIEGKTITYTNSWDQNQTVELLYVDFASDKANNPTATLPTAEQLRHYDKEFPNLGADGWIYLDETVAGQPGDTLTLESALTLYTALFQRYSVAIDPGMQNGNVTASPVAARESETISLTVTAEKGYRFKEGSLYYIAQGSTERVEIENNTFLMPDADVTVYAEFEKGGHTIEAASGITGGTVSANKTKSFPGDTITVTLRPDREFEYDEGTLYYIEEETGHKTFIDDYDESTGKYTFPMPADNITIYAEFIPVLYDIVIDENIELGAIDTDVFEAAKGQTVTVSVFPDDTYQLIEGSLTYQVGNKKPVKIEDYQFEMPSGDVEITAEFELKEIYIVGDSLYDREGNQLFNQEYIDENGNSYYFGEDGNMLRNTFRRITNSPIVYYYGSDGKMLKNGWVHTEGGSYYFGPEGKMLRNSWLQEDENHYYFGEDGLLYRDVFIKIGEYWYYFDANGVMVKDREILFA